MLRKIGGIGQYSIETYYVIIIKLSFDSKCNLNLIHATSLLGEGHPRVQARLLMISSAGEPIANSYAVYH
jgi:hypothetical protein